MVCSESGRDPQGQKTPKCLKTLVLPGILCLSTRPGNKGLSLSQTEVRSLKNTVWKTPFGTLRGSQLVAWCTLRIFFSARGRGRGCPKRRGREGGDFLLKIPGGEGLLGGWGQGGEGPGGCLRGIGGGGG